MARRKTGKSRRGRGVKPVRYRAVDHSKRHRGAFTMKPGPVQKMRVRGVRVRPSVRVKN